MGPDKPLLGDLRSLIFAWTLNRILLGDGFFEKVAWGLSYQGPICFGTLILATFLPGDFLGVNFAKAFAQFENNIPPNSPCW